MLHVMPAIIGIFWGAPLVARELETGTYRIAWTQGDTRTRWLTTKLLVTGASAVAVAAVLTLITTWWFHASDTAGASSLWDVFDRRNLTPIAYTVFAFALGVFLGTVIRRTLPAMAATIGIFVITRIAVAAWIRPHLLAPLHTSTSLPAAGDLGFTSTRDGSVDLVVRGAEIPKAWVESSHIATSTGQAASVAERVAFVRQYCPTFATHAGEPGGKGSGSADLEACRQQAALCYHLAVTYQPADRYWTFQVLESTIFVALALVAVAGCYWWITRRET